MKWSVVVLAGCLATGVSYSQMGTAANPMTDRLFTSVFAGGGSQAQAGGSFGIFTPSDLRHSPALGFSVELGALLPGQGKGADGLFSVNHLSVFQLRDRSRFSVSATIGYSRLFQAGNALNYGGGVMYRYGKKDRLDSPEVWVDYRDYRIAGGEHAYAVRLSYAWVDTWTD